MRPRLVWVASLPLMVAGSQVAHWLSYRLVYPSEPLRLHELLVTGHSYMDYAPLALGILGALELLSLAGIAVQAARGRRAGTLPAWAFASLPLLGFALQEHLERFIATGVFPWWTVLDPTFRIGLLLQIPFGLLVYVAARLLVRSAAALGAALAPSLPVRRTSTPGLARSLDGTRLPRLRVGSLGWGVRGPPARLV